MAREKLEAYGEDEIRARPQPALAQARVLLQERLAGHLEATGLLAVVREEVADATVADPERHHADRRDLEALPLELAGEPAGPHLVSGVAHAVMDEHPSARRD